MKIKYLQEKFNTTIDQWIAELDNFTYQQLCLQPNPESWSLGQVYIHLLAATYFFIGEMDKCLLTDDNATKEKTSKADLWFKANTFPDEKLIGPNGMELAQPTSIEQLREDMMKLKATISSNAIKISESIIQGKTKHPAHQYFSATEWFQYAEMHFRHHGRQKERIEGFLKQCT